MLELIIFITIIIPLGIIVGIIDCYLSDNNYSLFWNQLVILLYALFVAGILTIFH